MIFFDQDSEPTNDLIIGLRDKFIELSHTSKIAAIGPKIIDKSSITGTQDSNTVYEIDKIISSGTFTSLKNIECIGGMDEKLFIDFVDHEWCWRARFNGYNIFITSSFHLNHRIGIKNVKFWGIHLHITAPIRYFYRYRNFRKLISRKYVPFKWKCHTFLHFLIIMFLIPFCTAFKGQKISSLKYAIMGIFSK